MSLSLILLSTSALIIATDSSNDSKKTLRMEHYAILSEQHPFLNDLLYMCVKTQSTLQNIINIYPNDQTIRDVYKHPSKDYYFVVSNPMRSVNKLLLWRIIGIQQHHFITYHNGTIDGTPRFINPQTDTNEIIIEPVWTESGTSYDLSNTLTFTKTCSNLLNHKLQNVSRVIFELQQKSDGKIFELRQDLNQTTETTINMEKAYRTQIRIYWIVIVVMVVLYIIIIIVYCCNLRKARIYRLKQMHRYVNKRESEIQCGNKTDLKDNNKFVDKSIVNEGNETGGRWQPEQYDDMLVNSSKVQDVIIDDIVHEMENEGHNASHDDVVEYDDQIRQEVTDGFRMTF